MNFAHRILSQLSLPFLGLLLYSSGFAQTEWVGGAQAHLVDQCDPSYRLICTGELRTAHLLDVNGRYIHHWYYPRGPKWEFAYLDFNGNLRVILENNEGIELDWFGELNERGKVRESDRLIQRESLTYVLPNGNLLRTNRKSGTIKETTSDGYVVWEYLNPDRDSSGQMMTLCRAVAYPSDQIEPLLNKHGTAPAFTPKEIQQEKEYTDLSKQYKKLIRDVIARIEAGYLDEAAEYLHRFEQDNPEDLEGMFAQAVWYSRRGNIDAAMQWVRQSVEKGLPVERYMSGVGEMLKPVQYSPAFQEYALTVKNRTLLHGPMLGNIGPDNVQVWIRVNGATTAELDVWPRVDNSDVRVVKLNVPAGEPRSMVLEMGELHVNTEYQYEIFLDGTRVAGPNSFHTAPQQGEAIKMDMAFAGGAGYTPHFERMWDTLRTHPLRALLLLGDNVYIDHPERPATQEYCYYRRQSRPEFRRFAAECPIYAVWDDHDFTYNDQRGGPDRDEPYWKREVLEVFQQQWVNPYYGGGEENPGCWFDFSYGDVDFFVLDTRYYREDPEKDSASMLGSVQKQWLKEKVKNSTATFKVIASSVPWAEGTKPGSKDTWDGHPEEREELFSFLEAEKINGVLLISADRHRSDAWKIERPHGYAFYDLMSSKLTNMVSHKIMPGSLFGYNEKCSFGMLSFDTTLPDPAVTYRIMSIDNEEIHRLTITKSELTHPEN